MPSPDDTFTGRLKRAHRTPAFDTLARGIATIIIALATAYSTVTVKDAHKDETISQQYAEISKLRQELTDAKKSVFAAVRRERQAREANDMILHGMVWKLATGGDIDMKLPFPEREDEQP